MLLKYSCSDGSYTVSRTASLGLMYWYARQLRNYSAIPGPYSRKFLPSIFVVFEEKFHSNPFETVVPPDVSGDFREIEFLRDGGNPDVVRYEECCLSILKWLKEHGDISDITVSM